MEEGDFTRQRRNVFVVSILIIAYNVGGGDLSDLSFQGMKLENTDAVIAMVWIAFAYVVWRYWLYTQDLYKEFVSDFWEYTRDQEPTYENLKALMMGEYRLLINQQSQPHVAFEVKNCKPAETGHFVPPSFFYDYRSPFGTTSRSAPKALRADFAIAQVIQHLPAFARKSPEFSDVILPYLLAAFAVVIALGRLVFF